MMSKQELYLQLRLQLESMPDLMSESTISQAGHIWLARSFALIEATAEHKDRIEFKVAMDAVVMNDPFMRDMPLRKIMSMHYRFMAVLEMQLPVSQQGTFVGAQSPFDAMAAIGRILATAKRTIRIVDPYMNEKALTDFSILAGENVALELLSDAATAKIESLGPAAARWRKQYTAVRPLEIRLATARALHDRFILVDGMDVWILSQSLNAFAERAPATIIKMEGEALPLKIAAYDAIWRASAVQR